MAEKKNPAKAEKKENILTISKKASEKILELAKQEKKDAFGLRLYVMPGGCAGFQYGMDFEEKPSDEDTVLEQHGIRVFLDKDSLGFVKGSTIDFIETPNGSGFKIDNPNAKGGCSCGHGSC